MTQATPSSHSPVADAPDASTWDDRGLTPEDERMVKALDDFLDDLAAGHRAKMDEVVAWLTGTGRLEDEIRASVNAVSVLFAKWSIEVCFLLRMHGIMRFNEIKGWCKGIGARTLSQRLKDLEGHGLVRREVYPEVPVRVEYSLTSRGERMGDLFLPIIAHLRLTAPRRREAGEDTTDAEA